ncbi:98_t:CDS:2, partial [Gigaspora rosea]
MANTESKIDLLAEENSKLLAEISELRKENAEIKAENTKLKQDKEDIEARFAKPEQSDKEKTDLIAKLECDVSLIKQASVTSQSQTTLTMIITQSLHSVTATGNSDIYQKSSTQCYTSSMRTKTKSLKDKEVDDFLNLKNKERVSNEIKERNKEKKLRAQDLSTVNTPKLSGKNLIMEQELKQQLSTPIPTPIITDRLRDQDSSSVTAESIVYAFYQAIHGVKRKTATSMVYQEIKRLLPDITDKTVKVFDQSNVEIGTSAKSLNSNSSDSKTLSEIKVSKSSTSQTSNLDTLPKTLPDVKESKTAASKAQLKPPATLLYSQYWESKTAA